MTGKQKSEISKWWFTPQVKHPQNLIYYSVGNTISDSQCENSRIFLPLWFYDKFNFD